MLSLEKRKEVFIRLGKKIEQLSPAVQEKIIHQAQTQNGWFSRASILAAFEGLKIYLHAQRLHKWLALYDFARIKASRKIGVVMAGNIPMAGLHDFISVLISGHTICAKLSYRDNVLLKAVGGWLVEIAPEFQKYIYFTDQLKQVDAIIATGGNYSTRYFEYYFSRCPHIIRKNRIACAIIRGDESFSELEELGKDCLLYFGLGCRNVAKIFTPKYYDFTQFLEALQTTGKTVRQNHKYMNNYDYLKAVYLIEKTPHLDNGHLLLSENTDFVSPIASLYYETYSQESDIKQKLDNNQETIQCVVSSQGWWENSIAFGRAQFPQITDYADKVDTINFLISL